MIRLKQILESAITETPLADILSGDIDTEQYNVLFIGDMQTSDNYSYANNLLEERFVTGDIVAKSDLNAMELGKTIIQLVKSDDYDIISIMISNSIIKTVSKTTMILEEVFKFAKRRSEKLIVITNPIDFAINADEDPDVKDLQELSKWIASQNITDDIIDISNFKSSNFKNEYELNSEGHREILKRWKDILEEYEFDPISSIIRSKRKSKKITSADSELSTTFKPEPAIVTGDNGRLSMSQLKSIGNGLYLAPAAADAYLAMKTASFDDGLTELDWDITDAYRTYEQQDAGFDWELYKKTGKKAKKGTNGRVAMAYPGTSNHGLGKAIDLSGAAQNWVRENGDEYGWSWDEGRAAGEKWHFRYKL